MEESEDCKLDDLLALFSDSEEENDESSKSYSLKTGKECNNEHTLDENREDYLNKPDTGIFSLELCCFLVTHHFYICCIIF